MNVRTATLDDAGRIVAWSAANIERNGLDVDVLGYPTTEIACAENGEGPVYYLPMQVVVMLESAAPKPGTDKHTRAVALHAIVGSMLKQMTEKGIREVYFVGTDEETNRYAEQLGFRKVPWPVYKVKLCASEASSAT